MRHPDNSPAGGYWAPYRPTPESPWDLRRVVHLHRRAGFAATGEELRRDLEDGPEASVDRLLAGRILPAGAAAEFERASAAIAEAAVATGQPDRLKAWWIFRMLLGPDPLGERLVAHVAQPLRHRQPEGQRPGRHAAAERTLSQICPGPVRRAPERRDARPGPALSGSTPRPIATGTRTRISPAS